MDHTECYSSWLDSPKVDNATKSEIRSMIGNDEELKFRFGSYIRFGTAGLRSKMGAGTNLINVYTVAHVTEGVAKLILSLGEETVRRGVIISYDNRNNSSLYARRSAEVLASSGIPVYLFDDVRPTPELSFGIRYLGCIAGINITASHNPKEYNGYKLYWEDGSQPTKDLVKAVRGHIETTDIFDDVPIGDPKNGLIKKIGKEVDLAFLESVMKEAVSPETVEKAADSFSVVYTPLFGAGAKFVPEILRRIGLRKIYPVEEQMIHDGDFPGLIKPNPEYPDAFRLGIELALNKGSDLIIATDPDADRVGVMAKDRSGDFRVITGNQMGCLLLDYILTELNDSSSLPADAYAVKTIVTTELAEKICNKYNVKIYNVLTGFKFIAEIIRDRELEGNRSFILGFEESYGYLKGLHARDKDSVVTSMLICEMAAHYHLKGMTLIDALNDLFSRYGSYSEDTSEIYMEGHNGKDKIDSMMDSLRNATPEKFCNDKVVAYRDYLTGKCKNLITGDETETGLPESNVLYYKTENGNTVVIRPSGTEPKIKFYVMCSADSIDSADNAVKGYKATIEQLLGLEAGSLKK